MKQVARTLEGSCTITQWERPQPCELRWIARTWQESGSLDISWESTDYDNKGTWWYVIHNSYIPCHGQTLRFPPLKNVVPIQIVGKFHEFPLLGKMKPQVFIFTLCILKQHSAKKAIGLSRIIFVDLLPKETSATCHRMFIDLGTPPSLRAVGALSGWIQYDTVGYNSTRKIC